MQKTKLLQDETLNENCQELRNTIEIRAVLMQFLPSILSAFGVIVIFCFCISVLLDIFDDLVSNKFNCDDDILLK